MNQLDMFAPEGQPDLFAGEAKPVVFRGDPDRVRAKLHRILAEARAASAMPWTEDQLGYHQVVFPQMSRWLPEDEAAQLCFEFAEEIRRLAAA